MRPNARSRMRRAGLLSETGMSSLATANARTGTCGRRHVPRMAACRFLLWRANTPNRRTCSMLRSPLVHPTWRGLCGAPYWRIQSGPIHFRQTQQFVEHHRHQTGGFRALAVPHQYHADVVFGKETDLGAIALHRAGVEDQRVAFIVVDAPAQCVMRFLDACAPPG